MRERGVVLDEIDTCIIVSHLLLTCHPRSTLKKDFI